MNLKKKSVAVVIGAIAGVVLVGLIVARIFFGYDIFDRSGWSTGEDGSRRYLDYHGEALLGWQEVDGVTYYFSPDEEGAMATGWLETAEGRYFLNESGMKTIGWTDLAGERYYFGEEGTLCTGWLKLADGTYYFNENGAMHAGWLDAPEGRYYFDKAGHMVTGWVETADGLFYLSETGCVSSGWTDTDGGRCYIHDDGRVHTGWLKEEENTYYCSAEGTLHTGWLEEGEDRYYFHEDGTMAVGRVTIDGINRHFTSTGKYFVLVNPWNTVPEDYTVELVEFGGYQIAAQCRDALAAMREACLAEGLPFNITSIYRSHSYQTTLFQNKVDRLMAQGYSRSAAERETGYSIAIPGTSEHQLGLAVDIKSATSYHWLAENSWKYGFIVRYPSGDTALTGIYYEPWHVRYVGKELAKELYELGVCVEAYVEMLTEEAA